jgi:GcrA cell cycle regulator
MSWTDERVALLKKLWVEGKTAAEIASTMGNVTRNAVIGKAHRLKLSNRVSPIQQNQKTKKPIKNVEPANTSEAPEKKLIKKKDMVIPRGKDLKLEQLGPSMCRWPSGDPKAADFGFCGETSVPGFPYCATHAKIAYQTSTRNRTLNAEDFDDNKRNRDDSAEEHKIVVNQ